MFLLTPLHSCQEWLATPTCSQWTCDLMGTNGGRTRGNGWRGVKGEWVS